MAAKWSVIKKELEAFFDSSVLPTLVEYVKIPNVSPDYDPEWEKNGLLNKAMRLLLNWVISLQLKGLKYELMEEKGRTPLLYVDVPASEPGLPTVLMYAHMDKQPPLTEAWTNGLHPYNPIIRDGKLFGRGSSDDGYGIFAALAPIALLQRHNISHPRIVVTLEACEESGSKDFEHYLNLLKPRIGDVELVTILDSDCINYNTLWITSSLRGCIGGVLTVEVLKEGVHSGCGGGIIPDTFRIARNLLDRIEDSTTGEIKLKELFTEVPAGIVKGLQDLNTMQDKLYEPFAYLPTSVPECQKTNFDAAMRNWWKPCMAVTGAGGFPPVDQAGNVLRQKSQLKLSVRLPPMVDSVKASQLIKQTLERDSPYGAKVTFEYETPGDGWAAPPLVPWLEKALNNASTEAFGKPLGYTGCGGSIPLVADFGKYFPSSQFFVTGVLGPETNAHGPNEMLPLTYCKQLLYCVMRVVSEQAAKCHH